MSVEVEKIVQLGLDLQKSGQVDDAMKQFAAAVIHDADNVIANYSLAVIFYNAEQYKASLIHINLSLIHI